MVFVVLANAEKRNFLRAPYPDKLPFPYAHMTDFRPLHGDGWGYLAFGLSWASVNSGSRWGGYVLAECAQD